ncbi:MULTISPECIES: glycosyltransferase family 4 protein [unclassified Paenibacillus]|uniref:glycosyltransferase family 4 protein n=1 Tax=unclassified Paenibacillus TaxID=185978 RepID=UPI0009543F76|nr:MULTISPECIES: glycosyltransferase family 4 protein [unclassified Paenibacillus]ASS68717.1 glycosyltransferase family 4 protein [Paenibacillus sp. RUD330]SIR56256.1 Glycosyltransferase involved in cell wall bisynthesis [Paenibacillus sp. RU4X]SIR64885.1 Glycosyltransferase involved in cell wall bisynthesis [Paenibacillus sp. RU4T]
MKVAIIHDWLVTYAGAEKVLEQFVELFPNSDIFSTIDFLGENRTFIKNKIVTTTFIQKLPFSKKYYRSYIGLMPIAIEQLDLSGYDLIISSSYAVSKGVITGPDQLHISYVHSPIRYAWDLQHQYLKESGNNKGFKSIVIKYLLHKIRLWDNRTSNGVDFFISNSRFISRRIKKVYNRESQVVYPPVNVEDFELCLEKSDFYLTASRMVPYKRMDLIAQAFTEMADKKLIIIGDGPDFKKIARIVNGYSNIKMLGYQSFEILREHMQRAKAFIFAAEEDFGITPVEAQACGTPVIAFGKGGSTETVIELGKKNPTGIFFDSHDTESIIQAVRVFEKNITKFNPINCRVNAERFSVERFKEEFYNIITKEYKEHQLNINPSFEKDEVYAR